MSDMTDNTVAPAARRERHLVRRLYDWAFESAGTRRAVWVLAGLCYLQSLFLPLPPDLLLTPMVLAKRAKAWHFAGIATVSSVCGGLTGYMIGYFLYDWLGEPLLALSGHSGDLTTFYEYRDQWGAWIVAAGALTPFPYKLVAIASGAAQLNVGRLHPGVARSQRHALLRRGRDALVSGPQGPAADRAPLRCSTGDRGRRRNPRRHGAHPLLDLKERMTPPARPVSVQSGIALSSALTMDAALPAARPKKTSIWFAPSPPPARSERLRMAMKGTPLA